jgi:transcription elongation GreA/GreB family factor
MAAQGGVYAFTRNHLFASPSMAAVALMGRSANGWVDWKTPQGQTLDEVKRQAVKVSD